VRSASLERPLESKRAKLADTVPREAQLRNVPPGHQSEGEGDSACIRDGVPLELKLGDARCRQARDERLRVHALKAEAGQAETPYSIPALYFQRPREPRKSAADALKW